MPSAELFYLFSLLFSIYFTGLLTSTSGRQLINKILRHYTASQGQYTYMTLTLTAMYEILRATLVSLSTYSGQPEKFPLPHPL